MDQAAKHFEDAEKIARDLHVEQYSPDSSRMEVLAAHQGQALRSVIVSCTGAIVSAIQDLTKAIEEKKS